MELEEVKRKGYDQEIKYFVIEEEFDQVKKNYFVKEISHAAVNGTWASQKEWRWGWKNNLEMQDEIQIIKLSNSEGKSKNEVAMI